MALEAALSGGGLYQQQNQDYIFDINNNNDPLFPLLQLDQNHCWDRDFDDLLINDDYSSHNHDYVWDNYCYYYCSSADHEPLLGAPKLFSPSSSEDQVWARPNKVNSSPADSGECYGPVVVSRPKRRRARVKKNKEDIENQRMTHIAVERNRRKQMNDYLSVLRSLMPQSYVQRGDQASIVGGAINFVKELEQNVQWLSAKKLTQSLPFGEFLKFPQYTTAVEGGDGDMKLEVSGGAAAADVEVTMVDTHALVKIRSKRPPKQLSKLVLGLQGLRLIILHLNLTKLDGVALYSFSVKVEDESKLGSVEEIAEAVNQLLGRIQEEGSNNLNC